MEVASKNNPPYFSLTQLVKMALPNFPTTERGFRGRVVNEAWEFREVKARGRTGVRREYLPPLEVQALIEAAQRGEVAPTAPKPAATSKVPAGPKKVPPVEEWRYPLNVEAMVQAFILVHGTAKPGESIERTARRAVAYYKYCWDEGVITEFGEGEGNYKNVG